MLQLLTCHVQCISQNLDPIDYQTIENLYRVIDG